MAKAKRMETAGLAELRNYARGTLKCQLSGEELEPILAAAFETDEPLAYLELQLGGVDAAKEPTMLDTAKAQASETPPVKETHLAKNFARFSDPARVPVTVPDGVQIARVEFPQALDQPGYARRKVEVWLTPLQALRLYQLQQGLMACYAQMVGGKPVGNAADAIRWLLENGQPVKDEKEEPAAA